MLNDSNDGTFVRCKGGMNRCSQTEAAACVQKTNFCNIVKGYKK